VVPETARPKDVIDTDARVSPASTAAINDLMRAKRRLGCDCFRNDGLIIPESMAQYFGFTGVLEK